MLLTPVIKISRGHPTATEAVSFTGSMPFPMLNQQYESTDNK